MLHSSGCEVRPKRADKWVVGGWQSARSLANPSARCLRCDICNKSECKDGFDLIVCILGTEEKQDSQIIQLEMEASKGQMLCILQSTVKEKLIKMQNWKELQKIHDFSIKMINNTTKDSTHTSACRSSNTEVWSPMKGLSYKIIHLWRS